MSGERLTSDPDTARRLGASIRALRRARSLTLAQVAGLTDLSHAFLSQVERGIHQPSLGSLRRIAVALETSPVELVAAAEAPDPARARVEVVRAGEGAVPGGFSVGAARMLAHTAAFRPIETEVTRPAPGDAYVHAEAEFLYVVAGSLMVELDGCEYELRTADAAHVAGSVPHRWWAPAGPARLVVVKEGPAAGA
ncbi:helix-turn-helix domain-containing protein [Microbacterium indicum]|uniref:helix-turn-helix domain-containing protein n=1 Tax=Microbacterium indicum TaxID=358100 RepID=UPI0003FA4E59|nr:XRE family transcriptional regulator [Microbacterium indicum]